ncbi:restriction endonuclease subunit S [Vibrio alginolyticus]|uniref:restriction endonuclease subunit S n=1 Tax=Vibrio alginolyticus TaxID=663 RepID=UPI00215D17CC|nr:restriction endonuclease subunit S [Vibrio alginolyticus]MCR9961615.1 restriction endonuclease subunit S [Vibrio alginolyticus]
MSFEWFKGTWGDLVELKYGKGLKNYKESNEEIPVFGTNGPVGFTSKALCDFPSIIIGRKGAYRGVHFSSVPFWVIDTAYFVVPKKDFNIKWAYYHLLTQDINALDSGSAIPSTSREDFYQLPVNMPPRWVQDEIVNNLDALNKKINLNSKSSQTLEEMAQAIFKSWFVDFDPVKAKINGEQPEGMDAATASLFPEKLVESELGLIPKGWEVKPLDKVAHFQNGLALQKFRPESEEDDFLPVLKIAQLRQGYCDGKEKARTDIKESCRVYDGDMIFSWSGTLMIDLWTGGNAALNQHLFKVTSEEYNLPLYLYWTKHHLAKFQQIAKDKAVTMGHIKRGHLSESLCVIPPKALRDKMDEVLLPLINQGLNLRLQSNQLATLRDTLLPKLLSGEIELGQAQELAEVE